MGKKANDACNLPLIIEDFMFVVWFSFRKVLTAKKQNDNQMGRWNLKLLYKKLNQSGSRNPFSEFVDLSDIP